MKAMHTTKMKAIVQHRYGPPDVLDYTEIDPPTVGDDQVLVAVRAACVNPADWHMMTGTPYMVRAMGAGLRKPKRTTAGSDLAGVVAAVGANVVDFEPGDEVFGEIGGGAYAEYAAASAHLLALKPANMSFEEAAAVPVAGFTALQGLRDHGEVAPGDKVLINGASGGVGTFAVQIAKALGAEVTAVCSTKNIDMVRSIGADHVVDYTRENFVDGDQRYDVFIDAIGNRSLADCLRVLSDDGRYVMIGGPKHRWLGPVRRMVAGLARFRFAGPKFRWFVATANQADLLVLKELIEDGKVTSVIDRTYPLSETADALRYLEQGHTRGKSVITVSTAPQGAA